MRSRVRKYPSDWFDLIIADEAHHSVSDEWKSVISNFPGARVLGVTATPDRADARALGGFYQAIAFEISLLQLIGDGHLAPLRSLRLGVEIDMRAIRLSRSRRKITDDEAAEMIDPALDEIARAAAEHMRDRKTLVFLPRCDVSEKFAQALRSHWINARHVSGESSDRGNTLAWFARETRGSALCNAMLLTEGYDQPDVDCILCLRPTQSRALYCQIIGRGTRTAPGKSNCLILDPLWLSGEINLCQPADLTAPTKLHREKLQAALNDGLDLLAAEDRAKSDVEADLAKRLEESARSNKKAPRGMVDPLTWAIGLHDSDLSEYEAVFPWEEEPPTDRQRAELTAAGLWSDADMTRGFATKLLERVAARKALKLATPKQVMLLRKFKHPFADTLTQAQAGMEIGKLIR
jgi:superfamily II DNA or RNA helicase